MPTPRRVLTREQLREHLRTGAFRGGPADLVGVEVELTPLARFSGAIDLEMANSGVDALVREALASRERRGPCWRSGVLSREPGGQLEFSGQAAATPEEAARRTSRGVKGLKALGRRRGLELLAVGFHPWASAEAIGLRTRTPRYRAMEGYFDATGPWGRRMMRQTGSIQVNLDFGAPDARAERWELALRLGPILAATFANSAVEEGRPAAVVGLRGETWSRLDSSRTGIPWRFFEAPDDDPLDQYLEFALDARVMWIAQADGSLEVSPNPMTFGEWMAGGDPAGFPDVRDWQTHLGTLFPDVRAKGYLEIRVVDAPGFAWLDLPTLVIGHALRDTTIRRTLLDELRPLHGELASMQGRAHLLGLRDHGLQVLASRLFELVRPVLEEADARTLDAFVERHIRPGLSPGDELRGRVGSGGVLEPVALLRLEREWSATASRPRGIASLLN